MDTARVQWDQRKGLVLPSAPAGASNSPKPVTFVEYPKTHFNSMKQNLQTRLFYGAVFADLGKGLVYAAILLGLAIFLQDAGLVAAGLAIPLAIVLGLVAIAANGVVSMAYADQDPDKQALQQSLGDWILGGPISAVVWFLYLCCVFSGSFQIFQLGVPVWVGALISLVLVAVVSFIRIRAVAARKVTFSDDRAKYASQAPPSAGSQFPVNEADAGRNPSSL